MLWSIVRESRKRSELEGFMNLQNIGLNFLWQEPKPFTFQAKRNCRFCLLVLFPADSVYPHKFCFFAHLLFYFPVCSCWQASCFAQCAPICCFPPTVAHERRAPLVTTGHTVHLQHNWGNGSFTSPFKPEESLCFSLFLLHSLAQEHRAVLRLWFG